MFVYIVTEETWDYWQIKGVFATQALAQAAIDYGEGYDPQNYRYLIHTEPVEGA